MSTDLESGSYLTRSSDSHGSSSPNSHGKKEKEVKDAAEKLKKSDNANERSFIEIMIIENAVVELEKTLTLKDLLKYVNEVSIEAISDKLINDPLSEQPLNHAPLGPSVQPLPQLSRKYTNGLVKLNNYYSSNSSNNNYSKNSGGHYTDDSNENISLSDLRKLDIIQNRRSDPILKFRKNGILFCFEYLRLVIMRDRLIYFEEYNTGNRSKDSFIDGNKDSSMNYKNLGLGDVKSGDSDSNNSENILKNNCNMSQESKNLWKVFKRKLLKDLKDVEIKAKKIKIMLQRALREYCESEISSSRLYDSYEELFNRKYSNNVHRTDATDDTDFFESEIAAPLSKDETIDVLIHCGVLTSASETSQKYYKYKYNYLREVSIVNLPQSCNVLALKSILWLRLKMIFGKIEKSEFESRANFLRRNDKSSLNDHDDLKSIKVFDKVQLELSYDISNRFKVKLNVSKINQKVKNLDFFVKSGDSIENLKKMIDERFKIPVKLQRLIFKGENQNIELLNYNTFEQNYPEIQENSEIILTTPLPHSFETTAISNVFYCLIHSFVGFRGSLEGFKDHFIGFNNLKVSGFDAAIDGIYSPTDLVSPVENPVVDKNSMTIYENSSDPNNIIRLKFNFKDKVWEFESEENCLGKSNSKLNNSKGLSDYYICDPPCLPEDMPRINKGEDGEDDGYGLTLSVENEFKSLLQQMSDKVTEIESCLSNDTVEVIQSLGVQVRYCKTKLEKLNEALNELADDSCDSNILENFYLSKYINYPDLNKSESKRDIEDSVMEKIEFEFDKFGVAISFAIISFSELETKLEDLMERFKIDLEHQRLLIDKTQLFIAVVTAALTVAGVITGAFGMNLDNSIKFQSINNFFYILCGAIAFVCSIYIWIYWRYLEENGTVPAVSSRKGHLNKSKYKK